MKPIIAIIAVLGAGALFFLYTQPTYDNAQALSAQSDQYSTALDKATELQSLKQSLLSKYNAFDPNALDRLQKLLPDHVDNIALILDLDSIASRYGLALQNVDISTSGSAASSAQTAIGTVGSASQDYDSLTMNFTTQGSYATFQQFITDLESSLRIVDLVSLTISPSVATHPGGPQSYAYNITLRTYWLK
jgi:Tfp pilus assembly protein PilO